MPPWSRMLANYYWHIRVEGRHKAKRRRYYRLVEKEKLRLAELGLETELINIMCKYLVRLDAKSANRVLQYIPSPQMSFNFSAKPANAI